MTTDMYLRQYLRATVRMRTVLHHINTCGDEYATLSAVRYDKDKVQSNSNSDPTAKAAIAIMCQFEEQVRQIQMELLLSNQILNQIGQMENIRYQKTLADLYIYGKTAAASAKTVGLGIRQFYRTMDKALEAFEEQFGDVYLEKTVANVMECLDMAS